jgi:hypothetical protein
MQLYNVLRILEDAYEDGDFTEFVTLLAEDCVYESMWVLEPLRGREAVTNHLLGKGKSIQQSGAYPRCWIEEFVGNMNPIPNVDISLNGEKKYGTVALAYESGKFCLMLKQELDGKTNEMLIDLKLTESGMVSRMDLCMPELFNTTGLCPHVEFLPANGDEENKDALIRIGYGYFNELYLFLGLADQDFDEYDDLVIPMENWERMLQWWKEFVEAKDYDTIYEKMAGIDYNNWSVANKFAHHRLGWSGERLWNERQIHADKLAGLLEWTQKYCGYESIHTYGF